MAKLSRRDFVRNLCLAGGGLSLGVMLGGCGRGAPVSLLSEVEAAGAFQPNAFLQVLPDGRIVLQIHRAEMGQGVVTGLSTLVAEELEVKPEQMELRLAPVHGEFKEPPLRLMVTGGSASMASDYLRLRHAAASAREMLIAAAAGRWGVRPQQCLARDGQVEGPGAGRQASYGELAALAAGQPVPERPVLKAAADFRLIGRHGRRPDALAKSTGKTQFTIDQQLPGALVAIVLTPPAIGGRLASFDAGQAMAMPGVERVFRLGERVVVVATRYWRARKAAQALQIRWLPPQNPLDDREILARQRQLASTEEGTAVREEGEPLATAGARELEAEYSLPHLAHAAMEPLSCLARAEASRCELWVGNQSPDLFQSAVAEALGLPRRSVVVHNLMMGGSFGRRMTADFAVEAALISRAVGQPVKLIWSREDDIRRDLYRPSVLGRLRAVLTRDGRIGWHHKIVTPSLMRRLIPQYMGGSLPAWAPDAVPEFVGKVMASKDFTSVEGASDLPYAMDRIEVRYIAWDPGVPASIWRSVGHSHTAFVVESFVDEIAHALGEDPWRFRDRLLKNHPRWRRVLELAATKASWGQPGPGLHQGLAVHESFGTYVAQVVEVALENGRPQVRRVVSAVDCGMVINPDVVRAQVEGSIIFALTAALHGRISLREGKVQEDNFDSYRLLRIDQSPELEVHLLDSDRGPSGIGEPAVPPLAPALANAVFAATGKRLRALPFEL